MLPRGRDRGEVAGPERASPLVSGHPGLSFGSWGLGPLCVKWGPRHLRTVSGGSTEPGHAERGVTSESTPRERAVVAISHVHCDVTARTPLERRGGRPAASRELRFDQGLSYLR